MASIYVDETERGVDRDGVGEREGGSKEGDRDASGWGGLSWGCLAEELVDKNGEAVLRRPQGENTKGREKLPLCSLEWASVAQSTFLIFF